MPLLQSSLPLSRAPAPFRTGILYAITGFVLTSFGTVARGRRKKGDRKCAHESVWCHTHLHWINDVERTKAPKRTHDTSTAFCCISANTKWCASIAGAKRRRSARKTRCELSIVAEGTKSDIVSIKESNQFPSVSNLYYLQFLRLRFSVKKREVLQRGPGIFLIRQASAKARYLTAQPITV